MDAAWAFLIGLFVWPIIWPFIKLILLALNEAIRVQRRKRCLRALEVNFPNSTTRTFIAVDTSDRKTMAKLEKEIRDRSV